MNKTDRYTIKHDGFRLFWRASAGVYYCRFAGDEEHPKSTGESDYEEAAIWALSRIRNPRIESSITFEKYALGFFDEESRWFRAQEAAGYTYGLQQRTRLRGHLSNYLLPALGSRQLRELTPKMINNAIIDFVSPLTGRPLSADSRSHVLSAIRFILDDAVADNLFQANPARSVRGYKDPEPEGGKEGPAIFTPEEMLKLFPADRAEALRIWQTQQWLAYFRVLACTGRRPSEIAALAWRNWRSDRSGIVITHSLEAGTRRRKRGTKSRAHSKAVAWLAPDAELELQAWHDAEGTRRPDGIIFPCARLLDSTEKHFRVSAARAGVQLAGRTQYTLRHTYNTWMLNDLPVATVQALMSHRDPRHTTGTYNHPTEDMLFDGIEGAREAIIARYGAS